MQPPWMSVVVPAYNEEKAIGVTVAAVRATGSTRAGGPTRSWSSTTRSTDAHRRGGRGRSLDGERIRLLRNDGQPRQGLLGPAGMLEATGDLRLLCDADCAASLASLGPWCDAIQRGRRRVRLADRRTAPRSAAASRCGGGSSAGPSSRSCRLLMREPTRDVYCGFKLCRGEAADAVFPLSARGLDLRRRGPRAGARGWGSASARSGSSGPTARVAPVDSRGAHPRGARAPRRPAQRAPPGRAARGGARPAQAGRASTQRAGGWCVQDCLTQALARRRRNLRAALLAIRDHAGHKVQRPVEHLVVHPGEVAAENPDARELYPAEEQYGHENPQRNRGLDRAGRGQPEQNQRSDTAHCRRERPQIIGNAATARRRTTSSPRAPNETAPGMRPRPRRRVRRVDTRSGPV